ncbi:Ldh family oxidoreductase [Pannonibacter phragmitetus]|uniref:Ldh family oxidoreductase n=1 Tax=Pannonibacter phragmitetus TaxID=121719 RepID=UPI000F038E86|nr:Ldh family oxidoreductase [Pannonibacter phragmitetus]
MSATETLTLAEAHELAVAALVASNTAPDVAESVAQALVAAEADGQSGHGLSRVPSYAGQARSGKVNGHAVPKLEDVTPALFRVDACDGFAYPAFDMVIQHLPARAHKLGIAMAAVRRSHHFGQAGAHCEKLAEHGLAAFVYGNAPKSIAPWGGRTPLFGTNPIAFAAPAGKGRPPLIIDLAVSRVAKGKIMAAEKAGKSIPEGWALDPDGNPTTDASAAMAGTMIPIGEAKGAALAMMVEVMSAAMVGASLAFEAPSLFTSEGPVLNLGQTIIAIDPELVSGGLFGERMDTLLDTVAAEDGARLPGSRRLAARQKATAEGLAIPVPILDEIRQIIAAA